MGIVMHFYACGLQEVLAMPTRTFWSLVGQIPKLQNEESLRAIWAMNAAMYGNEDYINLLRADDENNGDTMDDETFQQFKAAFNHK
jgi:hypothetical protein